MVEDHPYDYGSFEGVIPKGSYGAGQVIVWDNGTYSPDEEAAVFDDRDGRRKRSARPGGALHLLRDKKLKGSWTLVKTAGQDEWLLIKHQDQFADRDRDILAEDRSVISGLSIQDLKAGRLPTPRRNENVVTPDSLPGARRSPFPTALDPMMANLTERAFSNPAWLFEPKLDGVRCLAFVRDGQVKLFSRRGLDASRTYPSITQDLKLQPEQQMVIDGEIIALDDAVGLLVIQPRINLTRDPDIRRAEEKIPVYFYVFDLLYLQGHDLRSVPLEERKKLLKRVLAPTDRVRLVEPFEVDGKTAFESAVNFGLEGVVAKRRDSHYESGRRSNNWLKVKETLSDDFVVGGYLPGQGNRAKTFGSLLLGYYEAPGRLKYVSNDAAASMITRSLL
jgi:bifunctional non-homologous end joining protein LigD